MSPTLITFNIPYSYVCKLTNTSDLATVTNLSENTLILHLQNETSKANGQTVKSLTELLRMKAFLFQGCQAPGIGVP